MSRGALSGARWYFFQQKGTWIKADVIHNSMGTRRGAVARADAHSAETIFTSAISILSHAANQIWSIRMWLRNLPPPPPRARQNNEWFISQSNERRCMRHDWETRAFLLHMHAGLASTSQLNALKFGNEFLKYDCCNNLFANSEIN